MCEKAKCYVLVVFKYNVVSPTCVHTNIFLNFGGITAIVICPNLA